MKNFALVFLVSLLSISSFSQENLKPKNLYSVGLGYNYIGNDGAHGILFTNDFKWNFSKRFALNPGISFFQTVKNYNWDGWYRSHSGFIAELCLSSRIIDKVNSSLSLKIGPSFEVGDVSYLAVQGWE